MAREEQQPMSDARLVTVRQRQREAAYDAKYDNDQWALVYYADVGELLDDNERLRAREAAWVKVAQVLAQMGDDIPIDRDDEGQWITSEDIRPLAEQARTLLASDSGDEAK